MSLAHGHLDPHALPTPSLALTCAARGRLRIGDFVEQMLAALGRLMQDNHRASADEIRRLSAGVVDSLYKRVKFYLTQVSRTPMGERESRKWTDIISFTINLEQVGDIAERAPTMWCPRTSSATAISPTPDGRNFATFTRAAGGKPAAGDECVHQQRCQRRREAARRR